MNRNRRAAPRPVLAALRLYPAPFRHRFGAELLRVIMDAAAAHRRGRWARAWFWVGTLADLLAGAVLERRDEVVGVIRKNWPVRCAGVAAAVGGTVFGLAMVTPLRGLARAGVPLSVLGMAAGAVGLYAVLHARGGSRTRRTRPRRLGLEGWGLLLAGGGLGLGLLGMAGSALGLRGPGGPAAVLNTGEHAGLPLIGAGMVAWGILALRTSALGRLSFAPVLLGLFGLAGIAFVVPQAFRAVEGSVVPVLFAGAWVLLGVGLVTGPLPPSPPGPGSAGPPAPVPALV